MAHVRLTMTAHGVEGACESCGRPFGRGETMLGIEYEDGEPAGWHCRSCWDECRRTGRFPPELNK